MSWVELGGSGSHDAYEQPATNGHDAFEQPGSNGGGSQDVYEQPASAGRDAYEQPAGNGRAASSASSAGGTRVRSKDRSPTRGDKLLDSTCETAESPLAVLTLRQDVLLDSAVRRAGYAIVSTLIRVSPALVIYGGTLSLLFCVLFKYRWGVLLSLLLYTVYMFVNSCELALFGAWGTLMCWIHSHSDWHSMHCKRLEKEEKQRDRLGNKLEEEPSERMEWNDVFHVVMMPTYKTPYEVLAASMRALEHCRLARTNMGVILAFEEREDGCYEKALDLQKEFGETFAFVTKAFHPPNLPDHVPGKSSNECWAFFELVKELKHKHGFESNDPRVVITVIDDDSELHSNYFEALTYYFLEAKEAQRYLTIWQPPIVHFKNYLSQPALVRTASLFTSIHELACLANPIDCHVPFSSYSLSLILASSVGGWDPDYISEDWHMFAKCNVKTGGRVRCRPIFLPLLNYAPEEDTCLKTIKSRWTQATRHALGVSEIVYVVTQVYLGLLELASPRRALVFLVRMLPIMGKFVSVHFVVATLGVWPMLSHVLIRFYMWRSWCYIEDLGQTCKTCCVPLAAGSGRGVDQERVILDSWMVYLQQQANAGLALGMLIAGGTGAFYFQLVKDRVDGDVDAHCTVANPFLLWLRHLVEVGCLAWFSSLAFASLPEWIAAIRIIVTLRFHHVVAGMVGRADADGAL